MPLALELSQPQGDLAATPFQVWNASNSATATAFYRENGGFRIRFPDVADFLIDQEGASVRCVPVEGTVRWQPIFEQQVVPLLMAHSGQRVYHGGAVAIGDVAVAFLGRSGLGKSTLVTAFARRGFPFFSDDCLLVEEAPGGRVNVQPHAPSIRLWEDSATALEPAGMERVYCPGSPKPRLTAGDALPHAPSPLPLIRVYVLGEDSATDISLVPLSPADTVLAWASNGFILDVKDRERLAGNLRWAARTLASIPAKRLDYPRRYGHLDDVVEAILDDVR